MKLLNKKNNQRGFTLLEMIISLAIFTIVALIAIGAILKIMDANRKSLSLKTAINNLNFALESMSREMRVGSNYFCDDNIHTVTANHGPKDCTTATGDPIRDPWMIVFNSSNSSDSCILMKGYKYEFDTNTGTRKLMKADTGTFCGASINQSDYAELLSPDIKIQNATIRVINTDTQPYAEFYFSGYTGIKEKDKTDFELKTSVTQRII